MRFWLRQNLERSRQSSGRFHPGRWQGPPLAQRIFTLGCRMRLELLSDFMQVQLLCDRLFLARPMRRLDHCKGQLVELIARKPFQIAFLANLKKADSGFI